MSFAQTENLLKSFSKPVMLLSVMVLLIACAKNPGLETQNPSEPNLGAGVGVGEGNTDEPSKAPPTSPPTTPPPVVSNGPFTANYKPMGLSWEVASRPERVAWSNGLYKLIAQYYTVLNTATDITDFCPAYNSLSKDQRINAWAGLIAATTYYESGYNPLSNSVDVGNAADKDTYSVGLMQMSVVDQKNYGFTFGYKFADLQDPIKNLTLAMAIMNRQVQKYKVIAITKGNPGLYWAVLYRGGKYDRVKNISDLNRSRITFCR